MRPPRIQVIGVLVLLLGFLVFARYLVRLNRDIQMQIGPDAGPSPAGKK